MSKPPTLEPGPGGLLIYRNPLLIVTVLGGVKLEGLDRLRVTLKVEVPDSPRPPVRHNLDLYNDNQLGKLVRVIAARLEVGMSVTEACLAELIEALEAWRLAEIRKQGPLRWRKCSARGGMSEGGPATCAIRVPPTRARVPARGHSRIPASRS